MPSLASLSLPLLGTLLQSLAGVYAGNPLLGKHFFPFVDSFRWQKSTDIFGYPQPASQGNIG